MKRDRDAATEQPTLRRLQKARSEGSVARSADLASVLFMIVAVWVVILWAPQFLMVSKQLLVEYLSGTSMEPLVAVEQVGWQLVSLLTLPCIFLFVAAALSGFVQVGGLFSPGIILLRFSRICSGPKQVFGARSRMCLLFSVCKPLFASLAAILVILHYQNQLFALGTSGDILDNAKQIISIGLKTVFAALTTLFILGLCDFCWQRYAWKSDLLMTRQEIIEEHKEHGGRGHDARRHATWLANRKAGSIVPSLIVKGSKLAVALRWNASTMTAPIVIDILRGESWMKKLEKLQLEGIAVCENNALAQKIMHGSDVGLGVPSKLHGEIASLLITSKRNER